VLHHGVLAPQQSVAGRAVAYRRDTLAAAYLPIRQRLIVVVTRTNPGPGADAPSTG